VKAYYNEFDPKAAQWLRQLIANGLIMDGVVDARSILEVTPSDLKGFTRHHFFAGIGGWELALQLANWPIDRPVCTASLPCQPFSVAGAQKGKEDERHLLPHFIEIVKQCNFDTIFGEQVPGAIKHGWLDDLCTEMEREKYRVGQIVLTAAGEGAPHIRQRLYWVADSINKGSQGRLSGWQDQEREIVSGHAGCSGTVGGLSNAENRNGWAESQLTASSSRESWDKSGGDGSCGGVGNTELHGHDVSEIGRSISESETEGRMLQSEGSDTVGRMGNTEHQQHERRVSGHREESGENSERAAGESAGPVQAIGLGNTEHDGQFTSSQSRSDATPIRHSKAWANSTSKSTGASTPRAVSEWSDPDWIYCRDEKYRPIKPSIEPLANGLPRGMVYSSDPSEPIDPDNTQEARVMRLKGYGNAIVPHVAASFIKAFLEI